MSPDMTAVHFVRLMAELSGLPPEPALERAHETLFYVGLGEARYRKLGTFSTGMKQMVKLAQALVHGPRLLMLDEPTNGLDPPARKRMLDLVTDIRDRGETHILLSSHLLRDVESVCDEVLILKDGRIAASCDLEAERSANRSFVEVELQTPDQTLCRRAHRARLRACACTTADVSSSSCQRAAPYATCTRSPTVSVSASATSTSSGTHCRTSSCAPWRATMAVYERTWRRYLGELTPLRWRWLVVTRYALADAFASRLFTAFYALCFLPSVVGIFFIYLSHNLPSSSSSGCLQT